MTKTSAGWIIFVAAIGMMMSMIAVDIVGLKEWGQVYTPTFVGTAMGHVAATIAAFVGGKLIPEDREPGMQTRATDPGCAPERTLPRPAT